MHKIALKGFHYVFFCCIMWLSKKSNAHKEDNIYETGRKKPYCQETLQRSIQM